MEMWKRQAFSAVCSPPFPQITLILIFSPSLLNMHVLCTTEQVDWSSHVNDRKNIQFLLTVTYRAGTHLGSSCYLPGSENILETNTRLGSNNFFFQFSVFEGGVSSTSAMHDSKIL